MTEDIMEGQTLLSDPDGWYGKMCPVPSLQTEEKISEPSSKKPRKWQKGIPAFLDLRGGVRWPSAGCIMGTGWSIAWRVHDAQFWGVPQRRKRIALVADFGGETAPEILFEREGVPGDIKQSGEEKQRVTGFIEESSRKTSKCLDGNETISFQERSGKPGGVKESLYNTNEQERSQQSTTKVYCIQENRIDRHTICCSQDAYDKYTENEKSATLKQSGGIYGGAASRL
jgi:hypothetical protein